MDTFHADIVIRNLKALRGYCRNDEARQAFNDLAASIVRTFGSEEVQDYMKDNIALFDE